MTTKYIADASMGGSDSGSGAIGSPYLTFAKALSVISGGDAIVYRATTRNEAVLNLPAGSASAYTTVSAYPGENVTLTGSLAGISLFSTSYVRVDGINTDLTGYSTHNAVAGSNCHHIQVRNSHHLDGGAGNGIIFFSFYSGLFQDIDFYNVEVSYPNMQGIEMGSASHGFYWSGSNFCAAATGTDLRVSVRNSHIHHCRQEPHAAQAYAMQAYGASFGNQLNGITYEANRVHDCTQGLLIGYGTGGASMPSRIIRNLIYNCTKRGIDLGPGSNQIVYRNTIDGGSQCSIYVGGLAPTTSALIKGNVCSNTATHGLEIEANCSVTAQYNDFCNGVGSNNLSGSTINSNNLTSVQSSLYVDRTGLDFRPAPASPLLNAGVELPGVTADIVDTPIPQGIGFDIGAYERVVVPVLSPPVVPGILVGS